MQINADNTNCYLLSAKNAKNAKNPRYFVFFSRLLRGGVKQQADNTVLICVYLCTFLMSIQDYIGE